MKVYNLVEQSASASSMSSLSLAASLLLLSPPFSSVPGTGAARDDKRTKSTSQRRMPRVRSSSVQCLFITEFLLKLFLPSVTWMQSPELLQGKQEKLKGPITEHSGEGKVLVFSSAASSWPRRGQQQPSCRLPAVPKLLSSLPGVSRPAASSEIK